MILEYGSSLPYSFLISEGDKLVSQNRPLKERIKLGILIKLLKLFFLIEKHLLKIKSINYPKEQFILSMWHCHQCLVYGIKDKSKFYALISASNDGEIIAKAAECLNIKSVRGSTKRRGVAASLELIDKLKEGNSAAIMVDGPRGPKGKVKEGIINIAPEHLAQIAEMQGTGEINSSVAKKVIKALWEEDCDASEYVKSNNLGQINDEKLLTEYINEAIAKNQKSVEDYKKGKTAAAKAIMGQVMSKTQGRGNPILIDKLLTEALQKLL